MIYLIPGLKMIFEFIQNNIFKMNWLYNLTGKVLKLIPFDLNMRLSDAIHFFIYDVLKIFILLSVLIFIVSYIQSFFPPERSKKIMAKFKGISANIVAALLGTVTPFCSCSSIPLFIGFTSAGLPIGVTFSFLISSPMVDIGSLILLMSIFGAKIAVVYVLLGLVIAVVGGKIIESAKMEREIEEFILNANVGEVSQSELTIEDRINFSKDQVVSTFKKVYPYVLVGVGIGAIIHNWIPNDFIEKILGENNIFGVIIATLVGAPMYADIFGTIPVAEALFAKGALLGTVLSFMMAVTTLSLPSLIMLRRAIKPRLLRLFIIICVSGIIIVGYIFNIFSYLFI
ncbi:putative permease [Peptoniphilus duerdenii ATCC BAA-1640]|uniref:Putative permease n=2 Tax=Peptoniphilus TaxID=162289 RepID=E0NKT1_9FIRM|nr:putative permease [Peptoniphilus duerdenii ATCC BAA-1640]